MLILKVFFIYYFLTFLEQDFCFKERFNDISDFAFEWIIETSRKMFEKEEKKETETHKTW